MANNTFYFTGSCKWAKLFKPDEKYGNFSIDLKLDERSLELYKVAGCQGAIKDGYVTFRRKPRIMTKKGEVWELGPPLVIDKNDKPTTDLVGNDSEVTVKVVTYDTPKGKGTRLEAVKVLKLVKYEPPKENAGSSNSEKEFSAF